MKLGNSCVTGAAKLATAVGCSFGTVEGKFLLVRGAVLQSAVAVVLMEDLSREIGTVDGWISRVDENWKKKILWSFALRRFVRYSS